MTEKQKLDLKEGDEAALHRYNYGSRTYERVRIIKVTPTGRFKTSSGSEFNPDGTHRGPYSYNSPDLVPITDDVRKKLERQEAIRTIDCFAVRDDLSTGDLQNIAEMIHIAIANANRKETEEQS